MDPKPEVPATKDDPAAATAPAHPTGDGDAHPDHAAGAISPSDLAQVSSVVGGLHKTVAHHNQKLLAQITELKGQLEALRSQTAEQIASVVKDLSAKVDGLSAAVQHVQETGGGDAEKRFGEITASLGEVESWSHGVAQHLEQFDARIETIEKEADGKIAAAIDANNAQIPELVKQSIEDGRLGVTIGVEVNTQAPSTQGESPIALSVPDGQPDAPAAEQQGDGGTAYDGTDAAPAASALAPEAPGELEQAA